MDDTKKIVDMRNVRVSVEEHLVKSKHDHLPDVHIRVLWTLKGGKYEPSKIQWAMENG